VRLPGRDQIPDGVADDVALVGGDPEPVAVPRLERPVVEVSQPHPRARQRLGKVDPVDAELATRAALSGKATALPKQRNGIVEAIRPLSVARAGALKARTAALQQLDDLVITHARTANGMSRRESPNQTSCADTTRADIGQGHPAHASQQLSRPPPCARTSRNSPAPFL